VSLPLGTLVRGFSIEGEFSADRRRLTWPEVTVKLGNDELDGTLSVRFEDSRPAVTGTLAAESLDLSEVFGPFMQARTASGLWSGEDVSLAQAASGDLDLRLSATEARIGRLNLSDMAASVLVRRDRIEASLGRAELNEGTLKGRLQLTGAGKLTDVKAQATFEGVELAPTLADFGEPRWITGTAQGQFVLEASGRTVVDLVRRAYGRAAVTVKGGELIGIGLDSTLRRLEKQPLSASLEWKGGRTAFERAAVALNIGAGVAEITEGTLSAATMRTALEGSISLVDRSVTLRAHVSPALAESDPEPLIAFDVTGGWDDIAIIPDARAFIERSRAAKPLFGLDRIAPAARAPSATAQ
jgi:AsmA protein